MANGKEGLAVAAPEEIKSEDFSITKIVEKSLNGKVDAILKLQAEITKDLEKLIEKLSM